MVDNSATEREKEREVKVYDGVVRVGHCKRGVVNCACVLFCCIFSWCRCISPRWCVYGPFGVEQVFFLYSSFCLLEAATAVLVGGQGSAAVVGSVVVQRCRLVTAERWGLLLNEKWKVLCCIYLKVL